MDSQVLLVYDWSMRTVKAERFFNYFFLKNVMNFGLVRAPAPVA